MRIGVRRTELGIIVGVLAGLPTKLAWFEDRNPAA
jgi:hypothetical protein